MFRNVRFYRLTSPWPDGEEALSEALSVNAFSPCSPYSERTAGWEAPTGDAGAPLARRLNGADLLQLRTQTRILPAAAVKEALEARVAEFRARMAVEPPRRELRKLREEVRDELLPRALLRSERTRACFLISESVLAVDAASPARGEWLLDQLRPCLEPFQCRPLTFEQAPARLLNQLFLANAPHGFSLGRECRMQDPGDKRAIASWREIDLADDSIRRHVRDGMRLTHLGMNFNETLAAVLSEDAVLGKLRLAGQEADDAGADEDPLAQQDAAFVLLSGTLREFLLALKRELGGYAGG